MYRRIRELTRDMREEGTLKKRRDASIALRGLLNDPRSRETLLQEATGKHALSAVWGMIIKASLIACDKALNAKKSTARTYNAEDIVMPYYILLRIDDFAKLADTDGLLSGQQVRELLTYCLNLRGNDVAMTSAGMDIMKMLEFLCSRPDFVIHFRIEPHMENILSELQEPLANPERDPYFEGSAKVFAALMHTAKTLGMGLHSLIPRCLEVVGAWCGGRLDAIHSVRASGIIGVEHMFAAAACILSSHPEHAIYALSERGSDILSLARQCYSISTSKKAKESIIDYFLAHL
jgi:hypothetical protein